jgi:ankyrin repeat protein
VALLGGGADVDKAAQDGCTPLHLASQNGHAETAKVLMEAGADVGNAEVTPQCCKAEEGGWTPLMFAANNGHTATTVALLTGGAEVDKANRVGGTPLMSAALNGNTETAVALLRGGADIDKVAQDGCTPLHLASQNGHAVTAKVLMKAGADVNSTRKFRGWTSQDGGTPLHLASQNGHTKTAVVLLEGGADIDRAMRNTCTPLYLAVQKGHTETAVALVKGGADTNKATQQFRGHVYTPLLFAASNGDTPTVVALLAGGADVKKATQHGCTPLHLASQNGHTPTAVALMMGGADVNQPTHGGWTRTGIYNASTPLYDAANSGHAQTVVALLKGGADVDKAPGGATPLLAAVSHGHTAAAVALLEGGAGANKAQQSGCTPLFVAVENGHAKAVVALLEGGADVEKATLGGRTPLFVAVEKMRPNATATIAALLAGGASIGAAGLKAQALMGSQEMSQAIFGSTVWAALARLEPQSRQAPGAAGGKAAEGPELFSWDESANPAEPCAKITISTFDASLRLAFTADLRATVQQLTAAVAERAESMGVVTGKHQEGPGGEWERRESRSQPGSFYLANMQTGETKWDEPQPEAPTQPFLLFVAGSEDKLQDGATVGSLADGAGGAVALFLLPTPGALHLTCIVPSHSCSHPHPSPPDCIVCSKRPCCAVILGCRHVCSCMGCARALEAHGARCPICRAQVHAVCPLPMAPGLEVLWGASSG